MTRQVITLRINGENHEVFTYPHRTLLEVLREDLLITGAKEGCGMGACGACTVIVEGEAVLACLTLALSVEGKDIITVEGLKVGNEISPLQKAFVEHGAVQCGFCTPGMLLSSTALLSKNPSPTEHDIKKAISGNLCRCTGYVKIVEAVKSAGKY
ncbi:MAG: (2Fe-2S)-binding protein [Desulfobacterales bacterium]|nr:(2Fe-2S)-binding protein [Desulfobacterales bacterium]